jgi:predicted deacylase
VPPTIIYDPSQIDFNKPGKTHYQVAFHLDGTWGYSLVPLTVINGLRGSNSKGVVCFGGTHGNEYEGQVSVKRLCYDLDPGEIRGRVILIPQLSESACVANRRESLLDGVNMNRAFPGNPRGTISYRISNFVKTRIFPQVNVVLDIHSGGREGVFPICSSFHPIPDPKQRAEIARVAQLFDTPFIMIYSSQMASGLLTDEAEAEGKVTIGGEFGAGESVDRMGTLHAYEGIRNVLRHYGLMDGEIVPVRPPGSLPPRFVQAENLEDYIPCPRDGVWEPVVELGAEVRKGDLLGRLHDFSDHSSPPLEIRAHRDGFVIMRHLAARARKGVTLFVVARNVPLESLLA